MKIDHQKTVSTLYLASLVLFLEGVWNLLEFLLKLSYAHLGSAILTLGSGLGMLFVSYNLWSLASAILREALQAAPSPPDQKKGA